MLLKGKFINLITRNLGCGLLSSDLLVKEYY